MTDTPDDEVDVLDAGNGIEVRVYSDNSIAICGTKVAVPRILEHIDGLSPDDARRLGFVLIEAAQDLD
ncbi:hypothetical protein [Mycobacterium sp.]|uniref:hypothetical protein n=1 Tax=Mycobacterium sp. TaxID=1785 RepID=UPI003C71F28E